MPKEEFPNPTPKEVDRLLRRTAKASGDVSDTELYEMLRRDEERMGASRSELESELEDSVPDEIIVDNLNEQGWRWIKGRFREVDKKFEGKKFKIIGRGDYSLIFEWDQELFEKYNAFK
jgi:hypothetical protein